MIKKILKFLNTIGLAGIVAIFFITVALGMGVKSATKKVYAEYRLYREYKTMIGQVYFVRKIDVDGIFMQLRVEGYNRAIALGCKPLPLPNSTSTAKGTKK